MTVLLIGRPPCYRCGIEGQARPEQALPAREENAMRVLSVVAMLCAVSMVMTGCKAKKRDPGPAPQVRVQRADPRREVAGISWFQGSLEEAFSRAAVHRTPASGEKCPLLRPWMRSSR
jgi:hypothetical protein